LASIVGFLVGVVGDHQFLHQLPPGSGRELGPVGEHPNPAGQGRQRLGVVDLVHDGLLDHPHERDQLLAVDEVLQRFLPAPLGIGELPPHFHPLLDLGPLGPVRGLEL